MEVVDAPLLKVPFESLKRAAKDRKSLVDEAAEALGALEAAASAGSTQEQHLQSLDRLLDTLQGIKRKLSEASAVEQADAQRCRLRLEHLRALGLPGKEGGGAVAWNKQRLDRILVDHLLRSGFYNTALRLTDASQLTGLVDVHIFQGAQRVLDALRSKDCLPALAWCADHRARLRKAKSKLEFKLHIQAFLELVRGDQRMQAIMYARQHLAPWAQQYMSELQRVLATLAYTHKTQCAVYSVLFEDQQWHQLADLFLRELYRLNSLTPSSLLAIHLEAGLAALKTPQSYAAGGNKDDPLHLPAFQKLAEELPFAKHVRSKLMCSITKEPMNDSNPPMVLPNGYVYSQRGIEVVAAQNGGRIVCPVTQQVFGRDELRRAFIV